MKYFKCRLVTRGIKQGFKVATYLAGGGGGGWRKKEKKTLVWKNANWDPGDKTSNTSPVVKHGFMKKPTY